MEAPLLIALTSAALALAAMLRDRRDSRLRIARRLAMFAGPR